MLQVIFIHDVTGKSEEQIYDTFTMTNKAQVIVLTTDHFMM